MPYTGQRICGKIRHCVYDVAQAINPADPAANGGKGIGEYFWRCAGSKYGPGCRNFPDRIQVMSFGGKICRQD